MASKFYSDLSSQESGEDDDYEHILPTKPTPKTEPKKFALEPIEEKKDDIIDELDFEVVEEPTSAWKLSDKANKYLNDWKNVTRYGKVIEGTNILPMKTPLMRKKWTSNLKEEDQFRLEDLIRDFRHDNKKIGVVIDLNYSNKSYYNWKTTYKKNKGLLYKVDWRKIKFGTFGDLPDKGSINSVYDVLNKNFFKDTIIAVHCTRGVTRTGYAIIHFLCKRLNWKLQDALKKFEEARGYPLKFESFVEDLKDKFEPDEFDALKFKGRHPWAEDRN